MGGELAPTPVGYGTLTRRVSKEICVALKGYLWATIVQFLLGNMNYEGRLVVSICLLSFVVKSKEFWSLQHGMGGPLLQLLGEECVAKRNSRFYCSWGSSSEFFAGRTGHTRNASRQQPWDFDSTRGYPGEDVSP